jgi:hypothetical protein
MANLKMSSEEQQEYLLAEPEKREYPYGLCVTLEEEELVKLGVQGLPAVGSVMTFTAKAVVVRVSQHEDDKSEGVERCVSLQITDMVIDGAAKPAAADTLYGG